MVVWTKKSSFLGSPRDVFRRPSAAPEPIAPKFLHTTFPSKYFVLAEFHPPLLSFGGVMPPTPSFASLQYGLPYTIWQAIIILCIFIERHVCLQKTTEVLVRYRSDGLVTPIKQECLKMSFKTMFKIAQQGFYRQTVPNDTCGVGERTSCEISGQSPDRQ